MKLTREQRRDCFRGKWPRITYPGDKPCPVEVGERYRVSSLVGLVVTKVRRAATGEWVLVYTVEIKESPFYLADTAPSAATEEQRQEFPDWQARGYTKSPSRSLDPQVSSVYITDDNDPILVDARRRFAEHRAEDAKEEHAEEQARQIARQLRDVAVSIHRAGGSPVEFLAEVQRQISAKRDELRDAA